MTSFSRAAERCTQHLRRHALAAAALLLVTACSGLNDAMTGHTDVVARAAGKELRVEETAQMLGANQQIPPDPQVVRALADLWIDYTLLATAVAEDSSLAALDLEGFIQPVREQTLVAQLREQVIQADTVFDEAEVDRLWAMEGPSAEISARHILLRTPTDATDAQRDSVRQLAESLRGRALAGEAFSDLATEFSQDPGSAVRGGDLGFFSRGRMVEPFEEAAFALEAGEMSEVVETAFGYHVILVDERRQPEIGEEREQFRQFLIQRALQEAEMAYLDSIAAEANVEIRSGGLEVVREIATRPDISLRGRAEDRAIATYDDGDYTAGEFARFVRTQPAQVQSAFASAPDEQLETGVQQLVQMELLLAQATARGLALSPEEEAQIQTEARQAIRELVEATGFGEAARAGATPAELEEHVKMILQGVVSGEAPFVPLGRLGFSLRDVYDYEINDGAITEVVRQLEEIRAQAPAMPEGGFDPNSIDPSMIDPNTGQPGMQGEIPPGDAGAPPATPALPDTL